MSLKGQGGTPGSPAGLVTKGEVIGTDPSTNAPAVGAGSVPLPSSVVTGSATPSAKGLAPRSREAGFNIQQWIPTEDMNVAEFGAKLNGEDDTAHFLEMLAHVPASGAKLLVPSGAGSTLVKSQLVLPAKTTLHLGAIKYNIEQTDGKPHIILSPNCGVTSLGDGDGSSILTVLATANIESVIARTEGPGAQEYARVRGIHILANAGATVSRCGIDFRELFITSFIQNVTVACNHTIPIGIVVRGGTSTGFGPIILDNIWSDEATTDAILITEDESHPSACIAWLSRINCENWGTSGTGHGIHVKGFGSLKRISLDGYQIENGSTFTSGMNGFLCIDGVTEFDADGFDVLMASGANRVGVLITNNPLNVDYRLDNFNNNNALNPLVEDEKLGETVAAGYLPRWSRHTVARREHGPISKGTAQPITFGTGSPNGVVTAAVGERLYIDEATGRVYSKLTGSGNTGWKQINGANTELGAVTVFKENGEWEWPSGVLEVEVGAVGAGAGGGGGGSSSAVSNQVGGTGGGSGVTSRQFTEKGSIVKLAVTVGAGGEGGEGGASGGHPGLNGSDGADTTVTGTGFSLTGKGGGKGLPGLSNSAATVNSEAFGAKVTGQTTTTVGVGMGGLAVSSSGSSGAAHGGPPIDLAGGGGGGGGPTSATKGGKGGKPGTAIAGGEYGGVGEAAGAAGENAENASAIGAGGGGGGGGAWNGGGGAQGAGGKGGKGGPGLAWVRVVRHE